MRQSYPKLITIIFCLILAYGLAIYIAFREPTADAEDYTLAQVNTQSQSQTDDSVNNEEGPYDETLTINSGDTLANILNRLGIPTSQAHQAISALSKVFNPKDLKVDQEVYVIYDSQIYGDGYDLKFLRIRADLDHDVELVRTGGGLFQANKYKKQLKQEFVAIQGEINLSLYADGLKAGASPKMLYDMMKALTFDLDYQRDIQPGSKFSLFYDNYKDEESGLERPGELLSATLTVGDKTYEIYRFQPPGGVPGYYTALGEATRKALMRTPIDGARLSSGFGNRKHPILGYTKMHKGVDFAAPKGTPIMAAGDGVIERCSTYGAYGNYICIKHNGTTKTAYAHLSRYAKGMKAGVKVRQGQVIAYVGATGRATGPHLHFELIQNGKQINPKEITKMPNSKLSGTALASFNAVKSKYEQMKKERLMVDNTPKQVDVIKTTEVSDILLKAQRQVEKNKPNSVLAKPDTSLVKFKNQLHILN